MTSAAMVMLSNQATGQVVVSIPVSSNLYAAGHAFPEAPVGGGAGTLPQMIELPPGVGRAITVTEVTGSISFCPSCGFNSADGVAAAGICTVSSWRGISAYRTTRTRGLMAVALSSSEPVNPPPLELLWDASAIQQTLVEFDLRQVVFIGDGLTGFGSGTIQTFVIPQHATRLFLGFVDGLCGQSHGTYSDNSGSLLATLNYAGCLWLINQPTSVSSCPINSVTFSVSVAGSGPFIYQWQYEAAPNTWLDAANGPIPYGSGTITANNVATDHLELALNTTHGAPSIRFRCIVTNSCGSATSDPTTLAPCQADFTCDGQVDDEDFVGFAAAYNILDCADPAMPASCPADLNGDGFVDDSDFVLFVHVYNELGCL